MVGKDQLHDHPTGVAHLFGIGLDHHVIGCLQHTGRLQAAAARVHHAYAAGADLVEPLQKAQGGDMDMRLPGSFQHRGALGHAHLDIIDGQCNIAHSRFLLTHCLLMAPKRHLAMHAPHLMHLSRLIW